MLRCRFQIEAEEDPQVVVRVLQLVAVRNDLPDKFSFTRSRERIRMTMDVLCRDAAASRLLECRIQGIPPIIQVMRVVFPGEIAAHAEEIPAPAFWI